MRNLIFEIILNTTITKIIGEDELESEPEPIVINIDLSWGDMLFDYIIDSNSTWNSKTHKYDVTENGRWVVRNDNGNLISEE